MHHALEVWDRSNANTEFGWQDIELGFITSLGEGFLSRDLVIFIQNLCERRLFLILCPQTPLKQFKILQYFLFSYERIYAVNFMQDIMWCGCLQQGTGLNDTGGLFQSCVSVVYFFLWVNSLLCSNRYLPIFSKLLLTFTLCFHFFSQFSVHAIFLFIKEKVHDRYVYYHRRVYEVLYLKCVYYSLIDF